MNSRIVDFANVDKAFQSLAKTKDGNTALDQLGASIDSVRKAAQPELNDFEFKYLITNLVNQRSVGKVPSAAEGSRGAVKHSGFVIKTAVD
jgi:hypothetical protein